MDWLRNLGESLKDALRKTRVEQELDEELEYHVELQVEENLREGMTSEEARRQALLAFGGADWHKERVREERSFWFLEDLARDLRFGFRNLRKRPVFALAATITLSVGIGMTTTMFTVVDSVLLRPLPVPDSEGLVYLEEDDLEAGRAYPPSPRMLQLLRDRSSSFSRIEAFTRRDFDVSISGEPMRIGGAAASEGFFTFLGVIPPMGRGFLPGDGSGSQGFVVVLSHRIWESRFGADPEILGQTMEIEGRRHQIVGVLPPGFRVYTRRELLFWIPGEEASGSGELDAPVSAAIARLTKGIGVEAAQAELDALVQNHLRDATADSERTGRVFTPAELIDPRLKRAILILQIASILVLLIGCGNLANLLLAQGEVRARELALRASLGANRGRLIRQLLVESLTLGLLGGVGGIFLTFWSLSLLPVFLPTDMPGLLPSPRVLSFALGLSLASVAFVGLLPALRGSKRGLTDVIKGSDSIPRRALGGFGLRQCLVVAEVAMTFVLLVSAGLLMKSFTGLQSLDTGFDGRDLLTVRLELPRERYGEEGARAAFFNELFGSLSLGPVAQQGPVTVATGIISPLELAMWPVVPEGDAGMEEEEPGVFFTRGVAPGYFETMGIPLRQGREFTNAGQPDGERLVIINEGAAERYFPDGNPVGRRIRLGEEWYRIVGVSGSTRQPALARTTRSNIDELQLFFPILQNQSRALTIGARTGGDPATTLEIVKSAVRAIDPAMPFGRIASADDLLAESLVQQRFNAILMVLFSLTAIVLGTVGIYGIVAYSVSRRIREIGVRVALGASERGVVTRVMMGGMKTVGVGMVVGVLGAAAMGRTLTSLLHEVDSRDPLVFICVFAGIGVIAVVASWLPARRAAGAGPVAALRSE